MAHSYGSIVDPGRARGQGPTIPATGDVQPFRAAARRPIVVTKVIDR